MRCHIAYLRQLIVPIEYQSQYIALNGFCLANEIRFKFIIYLCGHGFFYPIEHEIKVDLGDDLDHDLQAHEEH